MDLETPQHISELNSAIAFLSLKNAIELFSSEMCWGVSSYTSHPRTMTTAHATFLLNKITRILIFSKNSLPRIRIHIHFLIRGKLLHYLGSVEFKEMKGKFNDEVITKGENNTLEG